MSEQVGLQAPTYSSEGRRSGFEPDG